MNSIKLITPFYNIVITDIESLLNPEISNNGNTAYVSNCIVFLQLSILSAILYTVVVLLQIVSKWQHLKLS